MNNIVLAPVAPFWEEEEASRGWELSSSEPGELAWTRQWPRQGTLHYISLPPLCHTVWRRQNNYGRRCRTRQLQKIIASVFPMNTWFGASSKIQKPFHLKFWRGAGMRWGCVYVYVYACVGVCVCVGGCVYGARCTFGYVVIGVRQCSDILGYT